MSKIKKCDEKTALKFIKSLYTTYIDNKIEEEEEERYTSFTMHMLNHLGFESAIEYLVSKGYERDDD